MGVLLVVESWFGNTRAIVEPLGAETRSFVVQGLKGPLRAGQTAAAQARGRRLVQA